MIRTRLATLLASSLFAAAVALGLPALAEPPDASSPPEPPKASATQPAKAKASKFNKSKKRIKKAQKTGQIWLDEFWAAHALIQAGQYEPGMAALHALGTDDHPDVANYLGYASRKLGRYDEARRWYEAALTADPSHTRTWQYYGLWHLEQGNRLKAMDHLAKIKSLCGVECRDYVALKDALNGHMVY